MDCLQVPFIRVEEGVSWTQRFPNKKNFAQKSKLIYDKQIWKQMFAEILRFKQIGKRMLQEVDVLPRATEPPLLSAVHVKKARTNAEQTFL